MISSLAWVRKGAAATAPTRYRLTDEEYSRIAAQIGAELDDARADLDGVQPTPADADAETSAVAVEEEVEGNGDDEEMDSEGEELEVQDVEGQDELAKYNLDNYDEEDKEEGQN
ncbi:hypothetical protein BDK51DRAFT_38834, partial [Blyttiomyces helicus]